MPSYEVIRLGGPVPVHAPEYGVLGVPTLPEGLDPKLFAVRPVRDPNWRERERGRFLDGTYKRPPWAAVVIARLEEDYPDHFLHVSTSDPTKVAFTETPDKGEVDRQTTITPGRYLEKFAKYPDGTPWASPEYIRELASMLLPPDALKFATTPDEIEDVYVRGPRSCMSGDASRFDSRIHPARVYGAGDLAVAYLTVEGTQITARAVCWPEKKIYGRIYGDEARLAHALDAAGYVDGDLIGAKLLRIEEHGRVVCPYIDRHFHVEDRDTHLIISNNGLRADATNGYLMPGYCCGHCGEYVDEDNVQSFQDETWCDDCIDNHTFYCHGHDEREHDSEHFGYVHGIGDVCNSYYEESCYTCDHSGHVYVIDDNPPVEMANGETWSQRASVAVPAPPAVIASGIPEVFAFPIPVLHEVYPTNP